jgi:hypothetical protein
MLFQNILKTDVLKIDPFERDLPIFLPKIEGIQSPKFFNLLLPARTNKEKNHMIKKKLLFLLSFVIFLMACTSNEIGNGKDVNPESIYFDYRIWGDEESGDMTVKLQYRFAGPNGTTLVLQEPGKVELDGVKIRVDSSKMSGAYYEVIKPIKSFTGHHTIMLTDIDKKEYKEEFSFQPIVLKTKISPVITRSDLIFEVGGLAPKDYVRVLMSDTVSFSEGIVRLDTVINGQITVTKEELGVLASGPIHFELLKEDEKRVKNGTPQGGKLAISYGLKREFMLSN